MLLKTRKTITGTKFIVQADNFTLEKVYKLTGGFYQGKLIRLKHISLDKQIMIDDVPHRFITGELLESNTNINSVLEHLEEL
jgi:hypothetical protein